MKALLVLVATLSLAACLPVPVKVWDKTSDTPKPGDLVKIETTQGDRYVFEVTKVDEASFHGRAKNDKVYRVPFKLVKSLWVRGTETEWMWVDFPCCAVAPVGL
jgi:hypothetical protein